MINLMLGAPGGGKSYESVVYHLLPALNKNRKVITNLPLNLDQVEAFCPGTSHLIEIRSPELVDGSIVRPFSKVEHYGDTWRHDTEGNVGPLYIIDECHLALPLRGTDILIEEWYSLHRHEGADVLLITQSYGKINKAIRDLVQMVYRCRKGTMLGTSKHYVRKVQDGIRGAEVNTAIRKYEPKYFRLYRSHTKSSGAVQEFEANDVRSIWAGWHFRGAILCAALSAIIFYVNFSGDEEPSPPKTQTPPAKQQVQPPSISVADVEEEGAESPPPPPPPSHPFAGYVLFLSAQQYAQRESGWYHEGYIAIAQNGVVIRQVPFYDLRQAGYTITYRSPSVISLQFDGQELGYVVSALPQVTLTPASPVAKN